MRTLTVLTVATVLAAVAVPARPAGRDEAIEPIGPQEFKDLAAALESAAAKWAEGEKTDRDLQRRLRGVNYDHASADLLATRAAETRPTGESLYVLNELLKPLLAARTDAIRAALPHLDRHAARLTAFQQLPEYTERQADKLAEDPARQEQKLATERPIKLRNEQADRFRRALTTLKVLANEEPWDRELIRQLRLQESEGDWGYTDTLETIRAESRRMKRERAKAFYEAVARLGEELRYQPKRKYVDPGEVKLVADAPSTFAVHEDYAGIRILEVVNQLATPSRMPALIVPTPAEIEKHNAAREQDGDN